MSLEMKREKGMVFSGIHIYGLWFCTKVLSRAETKVFVKTFYIWLNQKVFEKTKEPATKTPTDSLR